MNPLDPSPAWHALGTEEAVKALRSDVRHGLSAAEAHQRARHHGPNALPEAPRPPWWRVFLRQLASPLIYILFAASLLAVALGHLGDAVGILGVVALNAVLGSLQEGRAERSMAALRRLAALQVSVVRDGREQRIEARELVPGDLLVLAAGDAVAADARLIEQAQLQMAEAALTGESVPVPKSVETLPEATALADRHDMVFAGTHVTAGRARAVVTATGVHTEVGRIAGMTESAAEPRTPLERRIEHFGRALVVAALLLFAAIVALGLWRGLPLADVLMVAVSQMVSMVPEGLPVAMTIALAVGMQRMAAHGAIIRRLAAVETLGSTTVICSDKTGTLTRNEMTVTALWLPGVPGRCLRWDGAGPPKDDAADAPGTGNEPGEAADAALKRLLRAAVLCNDAGWPTSSTPGPSPQAVGDPTETALLALATQCGADVATLRASHPRVAEIPFDADAQAMATLHLEPEGGGRWRIKGSPEAVLRLLGDSEDEAVKEAARTAAESLAGQALRVLAFAELDARHDELQSARPDWSALGGRGRLLGLAGEIDPPRDEARQAVADCRSAGIRTVMVTGDHKLTGLTIARQLGIAQAGDRAVDGAELERMGEAELRDALPHIAVFARVQPAQKLRIVEALQARGEVVAMTGDGVNDAPALARADVGVAMGVSGTEVAKGAAKIVLTDDNFATLVRAVEQGRVVYANLKKVILYLFATSADEVALLLLALLAGLPLPLLAVQILWINLVTEGTLTVNLVMDPAEGDEMRRAPLPRDDPLLDRAMLLRVLLMAGTASAVAFGWFAWRVGAGIAVDQVRTETFTLVAMCQWFNVLNCRSAWRSALASRGFGNAWLAAGLAASVALQALVLYLPWMNQVFRTVPLPWEVLGPLLAAASTVLWVEEARKCVVRLRPGR